MNRQFTATQPNQLWVADITFVATWSGFVYVAFVMNVFARCIVISICRSVTLSDWLRPELMRQQVVVGVRPAMLF